MQEEQNWRVEDKEVLVPKRCHYCRGNGCLYGFTCVFVLGSEWCGNNTTWNLKILIQFSQFSRSVMSDSLWPHESQHSRPPFPSSAPGVHPNSCASSWWCHPAISSSVVPFSSCPQSLPASGSFPMSQLFAWGGQSTGVSALASVLPMNTLLSYSPTN